MEEVLLNTFIQMKNLIKKYTLLAFVFAAIVSCEKTDVIGPDEKGTLVLEFDNRVDMDEIKLNSTVYTNQDTKESFTISTLNYFISNITLTKANGETVPIDDQYFLVREADQASQKISLTDIQAADYTKVSFTIGVDSLKSISEVGARKGVLDPASYGDDNMYWSWNMGYIFFKIEGKSSVVTNNAENKFEYHIGGFGGKDAVTPNNLKTISLDLQTQAKVRQSDESTVHVIFDVNKVFTGSKQITLTSNPQIHSPKVAIDVANNYVNGFFVDHVHN
ncbi:hypothetical protein SAMN06298216_1332 [Spirosomataceae bacterium TFI 002]|nr:hypothetical protein SAMN06298216_1332 [Spirosomataceae bacterium TFI 002]